MRSVLRKLSYRKAMREKGRSVCMIAAVFLTTILFVTVFSALFFVADAVKEMMRLSSPILADAALVLSEDEHERICHNKRVAEAGMGIRFAIMKEPSGAGGIQMFTFEDKMAQWMRYYPTKGRMPARDKEIVVSDQYLKECGLVFQADMADGDGNPSHSEATGEQEAGSGIQTELTYYIGERAYTDTFTIVGTYEMSGQPLHVALTSDAFYREVCGQLAGQGDNPQEYTYRMTGVMFKSRGNTRRLVSLLALEEGIALEDGGVFLNDVSLFDMMGTGAWAALILLLFFVMMIGSLFISNIFQISALKEVRFYGKLSTNGVTKREIQGIIRRESGLLFTIAVIPALAVGYAVSVSVLPAILNANTTLQIRRSTNGLIFVLSLAFSYLTVQVSAFKVLKMAGNVSPIEKKRYAGRLRQVTTADDKNCLTKFAVRSFGSDKRKVVKVCASLALSLLLACAFYTVTEGFDEEEYVKGELDADYIIARKPVFTNPNLNPISYARTSEEEIAGWRAFPGVEEEGGAAMSYVNIRLPKEGKERLMRIGGETYEDDIDSSGEAWVDIYGLDEMLLRKLQPIRGEIDWERFHSGNYVLLNPIYGDDNTEQEACYEPGERITVHFRSGEEGTYTVMAIVEKLPVSLAFPTMSWAGDMYLPMAAWRKMEKRTDYYLYAFDVAEEYQEMWDNALENKLDASKEAGGVLSAHRSARTEAERAKEYMDGFKLAGFVLSGVLLVMGMLNYINCAVSSISGRSREFAVLHSMGVEEKEIRRNLVKEGILYMAGGFVPGVMLAVPGVYVLTEKVLAQPYITYHIYPLVYLLFAVFGVFAAVLVPWGAYKGVRGKNF